LTDEFIYSEFTVNTSYANIDARSTAASGAFSEGGDYAWQNLVGARLSLAATHQTADGEPWRLPVKFEANLSYIPLATGVEAALIVAEAALQTSASAWLTDLNTLRATAPNTYPALSGGLAPLTDPGTDSGRVSLMFRERAFWLFGTGTRLGDLRRLIRQYGRDQSTVFPTGPYSAGPGNTYQSYLPTPIPSYGTDVDLSVPTPTGISRLGLSPITNPNYKGCITSTKTA